MFSDDHMTTFSDDRTTTGVLDDNVSHVDCTLTTAGMMTRRARSFVLRPFDAPGTVLLRHIPENINPARILVAAPNHLSK